MSKSAYTVEDFVLDSDFRNWVLSPDETVKAYWEEYLRKNPSKYRDIEIARKLILHTARISHPVKDGRIESTWQNIEKAVQEMDEDILERRVIPLNSFSTLK